MCVTEPVWSDEFTEERKEYIKSLVGKWTDCLEEAEREREA
jgi:hypothetical protein